MAQQGLLTIQTVIQPFNVVLKTENPVIVVYSSEVLVKLIKVMMIR